nr:CD59 glycoprotein isoform X3 [Macaca fascicularis]
MGIQGGSVLFGLLLVLAVFCHSGHSLQCYNCPNPTTDCKTAINCSSGFDTCLIARAVVDEKSDTHFSDFFAVGPASEAMSSGSLLALDEGMLGCDNGSQERRRARARRWVESRDRRLGEARRGRGRGFLTAGLGLPPVGGATFRDVVVRALEPRLFGAGLRRKGGAALRRGGACGTSKPRRLGA